MLKLPRANQLTRLCACNFVHTKTSLHALCVLARHCAHNLLSPYEIINVKGKNMSSRTMISSTVTTNAKQIAKLFNYFFTNIAGKINSKKSRPN